MFRCQVCGRPFLTADEMGAHLRIHGVNLFPEVFKLNKMIVNVNKENRQLRERVAELESRLRIVT